MKQPGKIVAAGFRRELGLWDTTVVVAGAIIGIGIFVNPSNVARILPAPEWMLLVWLAGGALAMIGGFVYAELGSRLPLVGGQYVYLSRAWGPFAGFLYGFALLFVINTGGHRRGRLRPRELRRRHLRRARQRPASWRSPPP